MLFRIFDAVLFHASPLGNFRIPTSRSLTYLSFAFQMMLFSAAVNSCFGQGTNETFIKTRRQLNYTVLARADYKPTLEFRGIRQKVMFLIVIFRHSCFHYVRRICKREIKDLNYPRFNESTHIVLRRMNN